MALKSIKEKIAKKPREIFLIDAIGAFLTTLFLGTMILLKSKLQLGMPSKTIVFLAFVGASFSIYSFWCSFFIKNKWQFFLKIIVIVNSCYCILTLGLLIFFYNQLTLLEMIYFSVELFVLILLIIFEWEISS
jgi:hypothetical protein